jgi:transcriptional regulator with XRE-family HTH domain
MTQKDLANALEITPQQIACYELGQTQLSLERFLEIAEILKIDPIKLLQSCINDEAGDQYSEHSKYSVSNQVLKESNDESLDYKDFIKFMHIFKEFNQSASKK